VKHFRQIKSRLLRSAGARSAYPYHWRVFKGDEVLCHEILLRKDLVEERYRAVVTVVDDHGHYRDLKLQLRSGVVRSVRIFRDGPQDEGVVEFEVLKSRHRVFEPDHWPEYPLGHPDDVLCPPHETCLCPACGSSIDRIPKEGWPCWGCRVKKSNNRVLKTEERFNEG
jgi:hypothetical protein